MGTFFKISWSSECMEMHRIEELLKCGICYDFINTTVMTPCSHNYCSLCIRKYLYYKTQCPTCFQTTFEKDLHTNRVLDDIITYFLTIRAKLIHYTPRAEKINTEQSCIDKSSKLLMNFEPTRPPRTNHCHKPLLKSNKLDNIDKSRTNIEVDKDKTTVLSNKKWSSRSCIRNRTMDNECDWNHERILCSICQVEIPRTHINKHLNDCIKQESAFKLIKKKDANEDNDRKPLPKLVINLMKDSELRKKMKQLNLPTQGDRKSLENRFRRYCTLYNAECDKIKPRCISELLQQCKSEELIEKKLMKNSLTFSVKVLRNSEQNFIDATNKKYLEVNAQSYRNLIDSIKNQSKREKSYDATILNEYHAKNTKSNTIQSQQIYQSTLSLTNPVRFNYTVHNISTEPPNMKSSDQRLAIMKKDSKKKIELPTKSLIYKCKNEYDNEEKSSINTVANYTSNNCCISGCTIRKRNHFSCKDKRQKDYEDIVIPNVQRDESSPTQIFHYGTSRDANYVNYTENSSESVNELNDCTMKRRRQQKCVSSIAKKDIIPPCRPARKRDSPTI